MKTVYLFDENTKEYLGETFAQESPLEAGVFIKPHCSTEERPLAHEVGKYNFWNGVAWELKEDTRGFWFDSLGEKKEVLSLLFVIPNDWTREKLPKTLEELKAEKNIQINRWRQAANFSTFPYQGKLIAVDELSRSDIDAVANHIALNGTFPTDFPNAWKATDNSYILLQTVDDFKEVLAAMTAQGTANFAYSQTLKAQLDSATTVEEIEAVVW